MASSSLQEDGCSLLHCQEQGQVSEISVLTPVITFFLSPIILSQTEESCVYIVKEREKAVGHLLHFDIIISLASFASTHLSTVTSV